MGDFLRQRVVRDSLAVGVVTGAYGASFGAIATAAGLEVWEACFLSLVMFTGASQFAFAAEVGSGGAGFSAVVSALLIGSRNMFYGLRVAPLVGPVGWRKLLTAQMTLDESAAMSIQPEPRAARVGFWVTGVTVFLFWNLATLAGALSSRILSDPRDLGLDAAAPAAFVALLWPRMRGRLPWTAAALGGAVALAAVGLTASGVPLLLAAAALLALGVATAPRRRAAP
ncbi:MAG: AzlC family ABC transporter permease [Dehalococcoidia bacterium]